MGCDRTDKRRDRAAGCSQHHYSSSDSHQDDQDDTPAGLAAGVSPAEDFSEIPLQELEQTKDDETAGNETVTRAGSVQNEPEKHEMDYIVNVNTGKFHYPDCRGVKQMKESNKRYVTCDRQELLNQGYESCGMCRP